VKTHIDPTTNLEVPYTPFGRFIHVPPTEPDANWTTDFGTPWWKDDRYNVGKLTRKTTRIKLVNMLTQHEHIMEVRVIALLTDVRSLTSLFRIDFAFHRCQLRRLWKISGSAIWSTTNMQKGTFPCL
jgi:hypothetical protein